MRAPISEPARRRVIDTAVEQQATNFGQRRMTIDLLRAGLLDCVSHGKHDDEGVHPKHRKEQNVKNVGHFFPLKPTVNITVDQLIGS